jgi:hypothetical protein
MRFGSIYAWRRRGASAGSGGAWSLCRVCPAASGGIREATQARHARFGREGPGAPLTRIQLGPEPPAYAGLHRGNRPGAVWSPQRGSFGVPRRAGEADHREASPRSPRQQIRWRGLAFPRRPNRVY